jgi:hypothetical protein
VFRTVSVPEMLVLEPVMSRHATALYQLSAMNFNWRTIAC